MDPRRLSTADILVSGIVDIPRPRTEVPTDRERLSADGETGYIGRDAVAAALDGGRVVEASNYYGVAYAWKAGEGVYRGTLLQYRAVTEDPTFTTAADAAEWFTDTYHATDG